MAKNAYTGQEPVIIKKYANRRLYNTDTSSYVTLDDLAQMVRLERDFVVYDAKSGEDLTHSVLTQIIVEQESKGQNLLPIPFLRQLIRFYGDSMQGLVPSYLEFSLDSLTHQQERLRRQFTETFGTAAIDAMKEQTRQNFAMFEQALSMFAPFGSVDASAGARAAAANAANAAKAQACRKPDSASTEKSESDNIDSLRAELEKLQLRLDRLSGSSD